MKHAKIRRLRKSENESYVPVAFDPAMKKAWCEFILEHFKKTRG